MSSKILLIDDEPDILQIMKMALESEEFQVTTSEGGREALELCLTESFNVVITDIRMPEMDGLEVIRHLKTIDQDLEIIVLTGYATLDTAIEALQGDGAFGFLKKPLDNIDTFLHTIRQALEKRRLRLHNKQLFEELQEHRAHLEELVFQRTNQLQQEVHEHQRTAEELRKARDAAEAANHAKSEFIANISHEIRTPLTCILGYAEILQKDPDIPQARKDDLHRMHQSGEHLLTLFEDILTLSKIEIGTFTLHHTHFSVDHILQTVGEIAHLQAHEKGLELEFQKDENLPFEVYGDAHRLRQVLFNLLSNAVKFTRQGKVSFSATYLGKQQEHACAAPEYHQIRFEVTDTGFGIPSEKLATIFVPFEKLNQYELFTKGPGLGLTISQRLVRAMGSELHVQSTPGQGSSFWFDLALRDTYDLSPEVKLFLD